MQERAIAGPQKHRLFIFLALTLPVGARRARAEGTRNRPTSGRFARMYRNLPKRGAPTIVMVGAGKSRTSLIGISLIVSRS